MSGPRVGARTMASSRIRSRMAPPDSLHLCDERGIEDGADPRVFFRRRQRSGNHKSERLCGAVHRTLSLCLSSTIAHEAGVAVESVEPAESPGRLLVVLRTDRPLDPASHGQIESMRGALRAEVAAAVRRRRVPDLTFLVLGPGEERA